MKLAVLGTGYVGLISGVCLAAKGHDVTCVDIRPDVVRALNSGRPHIYERGLAELLAEVLAAGRFRATSDLSSALAGAAMVLIAVGTPSEAGRIDLRFVEQAARQVGERVRSRAEFLAVVIKSTVIPGTTDTFVRGILEKSSGKQLGEFGLGMNPEFLREGKAIEDFMRPDRIVFGHEDARTLGLLEELYAPWQCDKLPVNTRTAELIKYASNCLLATQISAVNEIANLAAALGGVDAMDVIHGLHLDRRWTPIQPDGTRLSPGILSYLIPGCGFGGSCFPKDVQALRTQGESVGLPMQILNGVLAVNEGQPAQVTTLLNRHFGNLAGRRVVVLGLAFKAETDDVRESASRKIIADLLVAGATVFAHDPMAAANARAAWPELTVNYVEDWQTSLLGCDAVIIATRWSEYEKLASEPLKSVLRDKILVDARRLFRPTDFPGTTYLAIGFSPVH
jgi:UDPglucose 6-dehydrogenase/GDP-mannose 6-dehydrogenase